MGKPKVNSQTSAGNLELERVLKYIMNEIEGKFTPGNVYVVFNSSDSAYVQYYKDHNRIYDDGTEMVHTSLATAYAASTSNRNDIILLNAQNAHAVTSMLTTSNNRTHFMSMSMRGGSLGMGARSRITMGSSTVAADIALLKNTGVGNTFTGIKFDSSSTEALSLYSVAEGGEYTIYRGCEFYKSSDLDETTAAELLHNGDSTQYIDCYFGSSANAISTAIIRPCVQLAKNLVSGSAVSRDTIFKDCTFARLAGGTANSFVDATGVNDVERFLEFKDCTFLAAELGSVPAEAITASGGKQERGIIMSNNSICFNCTLLAEASVGVHVYGTSVTYNTGGIAKDA